MTILRTRRRPGGPTRLHWSDPRSVAGGRRRPNQAAIMILSAVLLTGCSPPSSGRETAGRNAPTSSPSAAARRSPPPPPATSQPPARAATAPITGTEHDWFTAVRKLSKTMNGVLSDEPDIYLTSEKLRSMAAELATCRRELARIGAPPTTRFQPAYTLAKQACERYSKGERCFLTAAGYVYPEAGSAADRKLDELTTCGFASLSDGSLLLANVDSNIFKVRTAADDI